MVRGNKGEWSEMYTFLRLLADGKLYSADSDLNRIEQIYYPIIKILRNECNGKWEYIVNSNIKVFNADNGECFEVPVVEFGKSAGYLLDKIKNSSGAFSVPVIEEFMEKIGCSSLKASSGDKRDITIVVHDLNTGLEPTLGFSIKSKLGNASTLLNAGKTTNFIYRITGNLSKHQVDEINAQSRIKERLELIENLGCKIEFANMHSLMFKLNLQVIDSYLPAIIAEMLIRYYTGQGTTVKELTELLEGLNPCGYDNSHNHSFYRYKIKRFLTDIALGLMPSKPWEGTFDASGGYIVVKEDGEVLCYHIYNMM